MNINTLLDYAEAANKAACVEIQRSAAAVRIEWQWRTEKVGTFRADSVCIPASYLEPDQWPFFRARAQIIEAAHFMERWGGVPDKTHMLFMPADRCMSYAQEVELLNKRFSAGMITREHYAEKMLDLMEKRAQDNALWHGANL